MAMVIDGNDDDDDDDYNDDNVDNDEDNDENGTYGNKGGYAKWLQQCHWPLAICKSARQK